MGGPPRRGTGIVVRNLRAIWRRLRRHHDVPEICAMRTWEDAMPTPPRRRQRRADGLSGALGRADLAAEFLRRNHTYRAEHAQMISEERRVGKEGVRTCRSRWSPSH